MGIARDDINRIMVLIGQCFGSWPVERGKLRNTTGSIYLYHRSDCERRRHELKNYTISLPINQQTENKEDEIKI